MSTGIGVDNIDIVFNELDILSAIDLKSRTVKETKRTFKIIRLGTTGGLNDKINLDDILFSRYAIGIDGIPHHYKYDLNLFEEKLSQEFAQKQIGRKSLQSPMPLNHQIFYGITCMKSNLVKE